MHIDAWSMFPMRGNRNDVFKTFVFIKSLKFERDSGYSKTTLEHEFSNKGDSQSSLGSEELYE
jgi:hypothetical protein